MTRRPERPALLAGVAGPVLFVLVFLVEGWRRPGYDPRGMFVSELSLGPGGWVQRANFVVSGALVTVFARAARRCSRTPAGRAAAAAVGVLGVCLAASGAFDTDPSSPPGPVTPRGRVHAALGAVVFSCMPVSCFLVAASASRGVGRRRVAVAAGAVLVALIALLRVSTRPASGLFAEKGLVQRAALVLYLGWLAAHALRLARSPGREAPAGSAQPAGRLR